MKTITLTLVSFLLAFGFSSCREAAQVAREEVGPRALLRKYEWFKDAAATLDKKQADLAVYGARYKDLQEAYEGVSRKDWAREDRQQLSLWKTEEAGVAASFNQLAAEYNAAMAKANWAFTNAGQLPQGATQTLPREFRAYQTN